MKQTILLLTLVITALGDRLDNRYLPPGPKNDNNQYEPPLFDARFNNDKSPSQNSPFTPSGKQEQSSQPSNQFGQIQPKPFNNGFANPSRQYLIPNKGEPQPSGQSFNQFGQSNNGFSHNGQANTGFPTSNKAPEQSGQSSNQFGQFSQPQNFNQGSSSNNGSPNPSRQYLTPNKAPEQSGQSSNQFGQFSQPQQGNNGFTSKFSTPSNQYFTPNKPSEQSGKPSNQFGQFSQPRQSFNDFSQNNAFSNPNAQGSFNNFGQQGGKFPGSSTFSQQSNQGNPIGLVRYEFNPDGGDGHYNYLYETENGITAQEEGFVTGQGKSAQGGYSYTSPEGEQITIEYTADENGFVPKGSHVPQIPEAILKSIELNKAAEARGEYNEGSYREEDHTALQNGNAGFQKNSPREQSSFASEQNKQIARFGGNNGYQYSGPAKTSYPEQNPSASQDNKQQTPFGSIQGAKSSFGQQKSGYQYPSPSDQGTFASQNNNQVAPSPFGGPKPFEQPKNQFKTPSNDFNLKPRFPEQNPSASGDAKIFQTPNKNFQPTGNSFQQNQGYQYSKPSSFGNNGFSGSGPRHEQDGSASGVHNQYNKFGTVQDTQGGYKY